MRILLRKLGLALVLVLASALLLTSIVGPSLRQTRVLADEPSSPEKYPPVAKNIVINQYDLLTKQMIADAVSLDPAATDVIKNVYNKDGSQLSINTSKDGFQQFKVTLFYGNSNTIETFVDVTIKPVTIQVEDKNISLSQDSEISPEIEKMILSSVSVSPSEHGVQKRISQKPDTKDPGKKMAKVELSFPNGDKIEKDVPLTVTAKPMVLAPDMEEEPEMEENPVESFKKKHKDILAKETKDIELGDKKAVEDALSELAELDEDVSDLEKKLEEHSARIAELENQPKDEELDPSMPEEKEEKDQDTSPMQPAPAPEEEESDSSSDLADKVIAFQDKHAEILGLEKADLSLEHEAKLLLAKKDFMALEAKVQAQLSDEKRILDGLEAKLEELKKAKKEPEVPAPAKPETKPEAPAQPELAKPAAKLESSLVDELGASKTSFVVGEEARLVIRGLKANEKFKLELHSKVYELGSFEADAKGEASIKFEIPTGIEEGKHQLVVKRTGLEDTKLELNVVAKEMLPETGEASSMLYGLGAIMMLSLGLVVLGLKKSLVAKD